MHDGADLVILTPLWGRPHRVLPVVESIRSATPGARVLLVVSVDDDAAGSAAMAAVKAHEHVEFLMVDTVSGSPGDYARKMNNGVAMTDEPLIFLGADDLDYHPGWFDAACAELGDGVGVVGTNDLGNTRVTSGRHSTHSLLTREYAALGSIDDPTRVLHEGYVHEFVDDEFVGTAKFRGMYAHAHDAHVEHLHPLWGKGEWDASYAAQDRRMAASRAHFTERQKLWAGRASPPRVPRSVQRSKTTWGRRPRTVE